MKNQSAARAVGASWTQLIAKGTAVWEQLPDQNLANVEGNFHTLVDSFQLRRQISHEESDRRLRAFFYTHFPVPKAKLQAS